MVTFENNALELLMTAKEFLDHPLKMFYHSIIIFIFNHGGARADWAPWYNIPRRTWVEVGLKRKFQTERHCRCFGPGGSLTNE